MPFGAARAVCTTFCYKIRWALTPIFGYSFIADCLTPDHRDFDSFKVPRQIIRESTEQMQMLQRESSAVPCLEDTDKGFTQGGSKLASPVDEQVPSPPRTRRSRLRTKRTYREITSSDNDNESEHHETHSRESSVPLSPKTIPQRSFTPINMTKEKRSTPQSAQRLNKTSHEEESSPFTKNDSSPRQTSQGRYFKKRKASKTMQQRNLPLRLNAVKGKRGSEEVKTREAAEALLSLRFGGNQMRCRDMSGYETGVFSGVWKTG